MAFLEQVGVVSGAAWGWESPGVMFCMGDCFLAQVCPGKAEM